MTTPITAFARISCAAMLTLTTALTACSPASDTGSPGATVASPSTSVTSSQQTGTTSPSASRTSASPTTPTATGKRLTFEGIGPFQLGVTADSLKKQGLIVDSTVCENNWEASAAQQKAGIAQLTWSRKNASSPFVLSGVMVHSRTIRTPEGAHVGMTYRDFAKIYGKKFAYEQKKSIYGKGYLMGRIRLDDREILLYPVGEGIYDATPSTKVMLMELRIYDRAVGHEDAC